MVTVVTNEVVFAGDRADLRPGGAKILDAIAPALVKLPNNIEVDGHTNQLKAGPRSTTRAAGSCPRPGPRPWCGT